MAFICSKSQRYLDGRPLIKIPSRTIEWRPFILKENSELFLHRYLESFAADALDHFLVQSRYPGSVDGDVSKHPHYALIRSLMPLISKCITSPRTIKLGKLDHLRRLLVRQSANAGYERFDNAVEVGKEGTLSSREVPLMSAEKILFEVQQAGQGINGGMNRYISQH